MDDPKPDISTTQNKPVDYIVSALKAGAGFIPVVGPIAAELIGHIIPNQRTDRIAAYLEKLDNKVSLMDQELLRQRTSQPQYIDLFEDSMNQAIKALSAERLEQIASLVKNGLTDEQSNVLQYKYLLSLLGELNDTEILTLKGYGVKFNERDQFWDKHGEIIRKPIVTFGVRQEIADRAAVMDGYREHLVRLGLLRPKFKRMKKNELPEFDPETGMLKASGYTITTLGRLLLRTIDEGGNISQEEADPL